MSVILDSNGLPLKYVGHATQNGMIRQYIDMGSGRKRLASLPVCPKCERVGLRDKGWADNKIMTCPHCGYNGRATHTLSAYLKEEAYR